MIVTGPILPGHLSPWRLRWDLQTRAPVGQALTVSPAAVSRLFSDHSSLAVCSGKEPVWMVGAFPCEAVCLSRPLPWGSIAQPALCGSCCAPAALCLGRKLGQSQAQGHSLSPSADCIRVTFWFVLRESGPAAVVPSQFGMQVPGVPGVSGVALRGGCSESSLWCHHCALGLCQEVSYISHAYTWTWISFKCGNCVLS